MVETIEERRSEPPLWSIGLAVFVILAAPLMLYSFAPTGPLREGDTVFSEGQQRVHLVNGSDQSPAGPDDTCLLDPDNPLIILQRPGERADGAMVAQVQGSPATEWPFCPPHAEVTVQVHQIFQKPAVLRSIADRVAGLLGR